MAFLSEPVRLDVAMKDPRCKLKSPEGTGQVYRLVNRQKDMSYIGLNSSMTLYERLYHHTKSSSGCIKIRNALQHYGIEAFDVGILQSGIPDAELADREEELILLHDTMHPNGYNLAPGGKRSPMHSEVVKAKQKATKATPESKLKQSTASKEVQSRPDVIQKKRAAMIATSKTNKEKRSHSAKVAMNRPETKEKHRLAVKASHNTAEYKAVASVAQKINQNRPEVAKKKGNAIRKAHSDPIVKQRHRLAIKKAFSTPEARANRSAAQKEAWKRKKALQAMVQGGQSLLDDSFQKLTAGAPGGTASTQGDVC